MSCQRGNVKRTRPQKYKNKTAFKNDLHDSSSKTKEMNKIEIVNVCAKCKSILEWKIKYKKYKLPKAPKKCTKCEQKTVKNAYHTMCIPCAEMQRVCPKCGKANEIVTNNVPGQLKLDTELQNFIKDLTERKRRAFLRYLSEKGKSDGKTCVLNTYDICDLYQCDTLCAWHWRTLMLLSVCSNAVNLLH